MAFIESIDGPAKTLLELGAGAGGNALTLRAAFDCTLLDLSESMLALSQELNPTCRHELGDMRTLRLGRVFDAVLVHDAICHMNTEADVTAVIKTAYRHLRPGGAAIFAPDHFLETFAKASQVYEARDGLRALRCLEWMWDPDPHDSTYTPDYAFVLRKGSDLRVVHGRHVEGLFARSSWLQWLGDAGFQSEGLERPIGDGECDEVFVCRRPVD